MIGKSFADIYKSIVVSIIVLTYNHEKYICQALDSILSQIVDFKIEILIGDDASTDKTPEILNGYKSIDCVCIFRRKRNIGATENFVDLVKRASGNYIASCEGDDYWNDPYKLQKQVDFLLENPLYVGCTHDVLLVDDCGEPIKNQKLKWVCNKPVYNYKDFKGVYLPGHPVSMVYRNIISNDKKICEFIPSVHRNIGDRTIAMYLSAKGNIARINETLACYRVMNCGNLTSLEYMSNPYGKLVDMKITNMLENYAKSELKLEVNYDLFRWKVAAKTFIKSITHFSFAYFDCFKKIVCEWKRFKQGGHEC